MAAVAAEAVEGQQRLVEVEASVVAEERRPAGGEKTFRAYDLEQVLLLSLPRTRFCLGAREPLRTLAPTGVRQQLGARVRGTRMATAMRGSGPGACSY